MRTIHWLFGISAALFIAGIGFVVAAARTTRTADVEPGPALTPVATVQQLMNGMMQPAAEVVFSAVMTDVTAAGVTEIQPRTDEEWARVGTSAATLAESGNLLMLGDRAVDRGDWIVMSQALVKASTAVMAAVAAKDPDKVLMMGSELNTTCDNCHQRYQRQ